VYGHEIVGEVGLFPMLEAPEAVNHMLGAFVAMVAHSA